MKGDIIKFGRLKPDNGHITVRFWCGDSYTQKRYRVELIGGKWMCKNGEDVTDSIERIEKLKQIKKLEASLGD